RGDHVAVVGLNGAGKSTLLKGIAGTLAPTKGTRELGYQVELAIFNQHVVEVLNPAHTIYESLEEVTTTATTPQEIRNMAGSLLFSSDQIQKKIKVLSGGEKSRVALGRILLQKVPFLLLDEPTNHLDFQTVEALTQALNSYKGTLIVVSHDRGFIRRVGTKILEVSKGHVHLYPGTYDEYVWSLQQNLANSKVEEESFAADVEDRPAPVKNNPKEQAKLLRSLEKKLEQCQTKIANLEKENIKLNDQIVSGDPTQSTEFVNLLAENTIKIQELEAEWLKLEDERHKL
ncbi:MAG: ABC-F family ATP-binding cassette domain-containing protein, partial [Bdellovibrionales bacterium]|nr:ABC-F family ATP-binding cassette domain-containing protein [Bdellovibrionales bacterium]